MVNKRSTNAGLNVAASAMGCGKLVAVDGPVSVQAFFVENDRNSQAAVLQEKFLDFVGEFRGFARVLAFAGVAGTGHLSEAVTLFENLLWPSGVEIAVVVQHGIRTVSPNADHLRGFFFQRHARKEVFGPLFGG